MNTFEAIRVLLRGKPKPPDLSWHWKERPYFPDSMGYHMGPMRRVLDDLSGHWELDTKHDHGVLPPWAQPVWVCDDGTRIPKGMFWGDTQLEASEAAAEWIVEQPRV